MKTTLEICAYTVDSAINAQKGGADRVELCGGRLEGGTTPSKGTMKVAREKVTIDIFPIIRPRGGDFFFTDLEFEEMLEDVKLAKELGMNGVVIGALTADGEIDVERCQPLVDAAKPMQVTFHRAFDMTKDTNRSLEDLIALGVDRVLTSGQRMTAPEGMKILKELVDLADGRIEIMAGSGVLPTNVKEIVEKTGVTAVHSSASKVIDSAMKFKNENVAMSKENLDSEYQRSITCEQVVSNLRNELTK
ncbi:copper homeostasis protein CutC [Flammeovirga yaeyamensis]|uniref:PF03932 family protein CutC n=1 Tax=Flammeovirga yaeyamensis TaxID=367791 RepID=A0AAX1N413_9BACT|nr:MULTISPECIES: copper homeostasis protein CutC [Flammeovirga]ANQ47942.2 copper homeostasis protein CutC [Flammeovirga sp. MY04]MBB3700895.1 copper homeostasis protein [Flammeovirga yaeyamensis]NMF38003.1 copper homeostasis protein CutC [Flammeovirga yaeyamensis]QWG00653.1 copper homeostasis protein CutC [Flammeovirga yaeyamensis]